MSLSRCEVILAGSVPPSMYGRWLFSGVNFSGCGMSDALIWSLKVPGMICNNPTPGSTESFWSRMGVVAEPDSAWISSSIRFMWRTFRILWQMRVVALILSSCRMAVSSSKLRIVRR